MQIAEDEDREELRRSVRRFLADKAPAGEARRWMETSQGYDPAVWRQAARQLGLPAIAIPEEYGGAGFTFVEQAIVLEEMGRCLYGGPYLASAVLATQALLASSDEKAKHHHLPGIASGATIATLAFAEDGGTWDGTATGLAARQDRGGWLLDGHKNFVIDGGAADLLLVIGRTGAGLSMFAADGTAAGLRRTVLPTLDQTRKLALLEFDHVPAGLVGAEGEAAAILDTTLDIAALALAAEQLGGAQVALDAAVGYAKARHQFGRPIGSFQAIKHRCADLLVEVESTRSAVAYGAWAAAEGSAEVPVVASLAQAYASEAFFHAAAANVQIHGGIGFTWEHDAHLYLKRAKSSELLLGDAAYHRERLAARIGI